MVAEGAVGAEYASKIHIFTASGTFQVTSIP